MRGSKLLILGGLVTLGAVLMAKKPSLTLLLGGQNLPPLTQGKGGDRDIDRDPNNLVPNFRRKLEWVFSEMRKLGFNPVLWEGRRTRARAMKLDKRGTGKSKSIHILGLGADIVDRDNLWNAPKGFWEALARLGKQAGLTSGSTFSDPDPDHLQAVPFKDEPRMWAMTETQRNDYIA